MLNFLCGLPDVEEADMKGRSNFIKKAKKGSLIRGLNLENELNNIQIEN